MQLLHFFGRAKNDQAHPVLVTIIYKSKLVTGHIWKLVPKINYGWCHLILKENAGINKLNHAFNTVNCIQKDQRSFRFMSDLLYSKNKKILVLLLFIFW